MAWPQLEAAVGPLRGRRFVAAFDPTEGWYRACVEIQPDVTAAEQALPEAIIASGRFLRVRLRGEPPSVYEKDRFLRGRCWRHSVLATTADRVWSTIAGSMRSTS